jgi:hypothetical protein
MIVVFVWLIGFGVEFRVVWVEEWCDLVEFWWSYGGLKVFGNGGL